MSAAADVMNAPWPLPTMQPSAQRLPTCIPLTYRDTAGRYCLTYPRSPFNRARYLVVRCPDKKSALRGSDLECVHDDFGNLVPMRQRELNDDFSSSVAWRPL